MTPDGPQVYSSDDLKAADGSELLVATDRHGRVVAQVAVTRPEVRKQVKDYLFAIAEVLDPPMREESRQPPERRTGFRRVKS